MSVALARLSKHNAVDALLDLNDDGFSCLEEFGVEADPSNAETHPRQTSQNVVPATK